MRKVAVLYLLLYGVVYAGWLFHRAHSPDIFWFSGAHARMLMVLALPFLLPFVLAWMKRRLGGQGTLFALIPVLALLALGVFVSSMLYYQDTKRIPFHPFLQNQPSLEKIDSGFGASPSLRILTLGGSTTANRGLPFEHRYPTLLQRKLATALETEVEVVNAGTGWFTSQDSLILLTTYGRQFSPDIVVVMHAINDLARSFKQPRLTNGEYHPHYAHYYGSSARAMRRPSFLSHFLTDVLSPRFFRTWYSMFRAKDTEVDRPLEGYPSLEALERNLGSIVRFAKAIGATPVLVTQATIYRPEMTRPEIKSLWLRQTLLWEKLGWTSIIMPTTASLHRAMAAANDRVRRVAKREDIAWAEGAPAVPKDHDHFKDDCHFKPPGTEILSQQVTETILPIAREILGSSDASL